MNVLSLFDGISCGQLALQRAGVKVDKYFASEIDNYCIKITQKNFPETIQLGDVNNFEQWDLPQIDLLIGGSPCQDLSIAKHDRKGLDGERSGLFWRYVDCLHKFKPKYFLFENVASMSKEAKETITEALGIESIMINSALVSAQQRKRLYWTNIPNVKLPGDKGIVLKDIILHGEPYLDKAQAITTTYNRGVFIDSIRNRRRTMIAEPVFLEKVELVAEPKMDIQKSIYVGEVKNNGYKNGKQSSVEYRIYSVKGKSLSLNGFQTNYMIDLPDGDYIIRKLYPLECERLQTLPDNYTLCEGVSNTQRYKCIGNGWTVDVIVVILKCLDEVI